MSAIKVKVASDKRWLHDPQSGPYYIPGGGVFTPEDGEPFYVRHLQFEPADPADPTGIFADGAPRLPIGLVLLDCSEPADLTGQAMEITLNPVAP